MRQHKLVSTSLLDLSLDCFMWNSVGQVFACGFLLGGKHRAWLITCKPYLIAKTCTDPKSSVTLILGLLGKALC